MRTQPVSRSVSVVLNGSGAGTAQLGPTLTSEVWTVSVAAVKCSTNTNEAVCSVYQGIAAGTGLVGATTWGSTGDSTSNFAAPLYPGQYVFAVWTGGDAGATATLTVTGTRQVP